MALTGSLGTTMSVSATLPTTHDATGVGALTPTAVGKLESLPDLNGTRDIATFTNIETGEEEKFADVLRAGSGEVMLGLDNADAGQVILEDALGTGAKIIVQFVLPSGIEYWRQCVITSFTPTGIGPGNVPMAQVGLEFEKTTIKVTP